MNNSAPHHLFQAAFSVLLTLARRHSVDLSVEANMTFMVAQAEVNAQNHQLLLASEKLNHRVQK